MFSDWIDCENSLSLRSYDEHQEPRPDPEAVTRFIRVTGTNLENIARGRYNSETGTMVVEKRPNFRGAA
jgi:hypothetical protein